MLRIRNCESGYGALRVLSGVSLHVNAGEVVTIIGANGAGKTTLLSTIAGLVTARQGSITFKGKEIGGLAPERIVAAGCSLVPEGRQVFAPLSVRENLLLGAYVRLGRESRSRIQETLEGNYVLFPRLRERAAQLAGTLSGGEQQMLAIARALMSQPALIMLDEPSMGLAPLVVRDIFRTLLKLRDEGNTILLVEQNARAALGIADRGYVLETGSIVMEGSSHDLLDSNEVRRSYLGKEYRSIDE